MSIMLPRCMCLTTATIILLLHLFTGANGQALFRDSPHNATSLLSARAVLTCSVTDNPPANIRWTKNEVVITSSDRINVSYNSTSGESRLVINDLQFTDNGAYRCQALDSADSVIGTSDIGYITAMGAPVFRMPLGPVEVSLGAEAMFNCDVYSNPVADSVRWTFNGVNIVSDNLRILVTNTQLVIQNVQNGDEGSYACTVTNGFGTQTSSAILSIVALSILTITTRPSGNLDVVEGETVSITCSVEGGTPSTLDWFRSGMRLGESGAVSVSHTSPNVVVLTLHSVISSYDGDFTCVAVNSTGDTYREVVTLNVLMLPQFTDRPGNFTVNVGDIILPKTPCVAMGDPSPVYSWLGINGVPLPGVTGSRPILGLASFSAAGQYSCVARNSVGESVVKFYVTVEGTPVIAPIPQQIDVGVGSSVSVACSVQGAPTPLVRWAKASSPSSLPSNAHVTPDNNLTINAITFGNNGTYQCTASNTCISCGNVTASTTIIVHGPPVVAEAPVDIHATTGDTVSLQCQFISSLPVNITWTKQSGSQVTTVAMDERTSVITNSSCTTCAGMSIGQIIISDTTSDDNGLYTCSGETIAGRAVTAAEVIVGTPPVFNSGPQGVDLVIGENITLTCSASGDPVPQITWERIDQSGMVTVVSGSDVIALSNGDLPLTNLQQNDTGLYHCIADNRVARIELTATVRVAGPPLVRSITPTIIVAGDEIMLTCNLIFDYPSPNIQWSRSDGVPTNAGRMNVLSDGSLTIVPATLSDATTFTCTATNQHGTSSVSALVTVHFRPTILPVVTNYTHFINEMASLPCVVSSNPPSTIRWRLGVDMTELQASDKYQIDPDSGTLLIRGLRLSDSNVYHCFANNTIGSDTAATYVTVEGPPPGSITVNTSDFDSLFVEWDESSVTSLDLVTYQIMFSEEPVDEIMSVTILNQNNLNNRSVTLYGLRAFTEYRITVSGGYRYEPESGDVTIVYGINSTTTATTAENFPTASPQNITTSSGAEEVDIFFKSLPEGDRNGIIVGYNIYYRSSPPANYRNASGGFYTDNGTNITITNFTLVKFRPNNPNANSYQYTLSGLSDDSSYDFFMEAFNSVGAGPNTTIFTAQTDKAFPTTVVIVVTSTVGGLIIVTLTVLLVICCYFYCRRRRRSHEAKADRKTARDVKKLIISEPTTDIPPDTTSSSKFSGRNLEGEAIPLNPKVVRPEDRAPSPAPGETALPVKSVTLKVEDQTDRPVSGLYSEPADSLSRYNSENFDEKSTEEEIKAVDDAFKDITDKEPLYASVPESHKQAKKMKKSKLVRKSSKPEVPTIAEEVTRQGIDTSTAEGQKMLRMLDATSAGMF